MMIRRNGVLPPFLILSLHPSLSPFFSCRCFFRSFVLCHYYSDFLQLLKDFKVLTGSVTGPYVSTLLATEDSMLTFRRFVALLLSIGETLQPRYPKQDAFLALLETMVSNVRSSVGVLIPWLEYIAGTCMTKQTQRRYLYCNYYYYFCILFHRISSSLLLLISIYLIRISWQDYSEQLYIILESGLVLNKEVNQFESHTDKSIDLSVSSFNTVALHNQSCIIH